MQTTEVAHLLQQVLDATSCDATRVALALDRTGSGLIEARAIICGLAALIFTRSRDRLRAVWPFFAQHHSPPTAERALPRLDSSAIVDLFKVVAILYHGMHVLYYTMACMYYTIP